MKILFQKFEKEFIKTYREIQKLDPIPEKQEKVIETKEKGDKEEEKKEVY